MRVKIRNFCLKRIDNWDYFVSSKGWHHLVTPDIIVFRLLGLCWLWGHDPIPDETNDPSNDICGWCNESMPYQAPR